MKPEGRQLPIVVIGGANLDLTGQSAGTWVQGESLPGRVTSSPGGVGRNVAEALSRLGRFTKLITALGDDGFAEDLARQTSVSGVDLRATLRVPEGRTPTYLSVLDAKGEMQVAINDMALVDCITPDSLRERLRDLTEAKAWVVDANLTEEALAFLFENCGDIPVYCEPVSLAKSVKLKPYLPQLTGMKPNRTEAAALTGLDADDASPEDLVLALMDLGISQVFLSLGQQGLCAGFAGQDVQTKPALLIDVQSVTGAGDTLLAGAIDAVLAGFSLSDTMDWAQAAARLSLQSNRAIPPGLCEAAVRSELERAE